MPSDTFQGRGNLIGHPTRFTGGGQGSHDGGNGGDEMLEARVARLESDVEYIRRDVSEIKSDLKEIRKDMRTDFRWVIVMGLAMLGVMAKGFGWIG